VLIVFF
jgi:hypothetical protein